MNGPFTSWGDCLKQHAVGVLVRITEEFYVRHTCNPSLTVVERLGESVPSLAKRPQSIVVWVDRSLSCISVQWKVTIIPLEF